MKVSIDTNPLYVTKAGVARYVRGLLQGFEQIDDSRLEIHTLAWETQNLNYRQPARTLKTLYRELVWYRHIAPSLMKQNNIDLLHISQLAPFRYPRGTRTVCTLHDCAILRFPQRFRKWQRIAGAQYLKRAVRSDRVICISRFAADEAISLLGIPANKLEIIHLGNSFSNSQIVPRQPEVDIPKTFILFVGSLEPGKNLQLLSETYRMADDRNVDIPPLVIVGTRWPDVEQELPHEKWIYLDHQPDSALAYLYQQAFALLFPSKYEGFGLPVLEAMSFGCPVLCSKVASIPEVAGDAALYTEQTPEDYLLKISELLKDNSLHSHLRAAGREQAGKFSWERCASQTRDVYLELL